MGTHISSLYLGLSFHSPDSIFDERTFLILLKFSFNGVYYSFLLWLVLLMSCLKILAPTMLFSYVFFQEFFCFPFTFRFTTHPSYMHFLKSSPQLRSQLRFSFTHSCLSSLIHLILQAPRLAQPLRVKKSG